jgi:hypothetical protein
MISELEKKVNMEKHTLHEKNKFLGEKKKDEKDLNEEEIKLLKKKIQEAIDFNSTEENFQEALKNSFRILTKQSIPDEVLDILEDERTTKLSKER